MENIQWTKSRGRALKRSAAYKINRFTRWFSLLAAIAFFGCLLWVNKRGASDLTMLIMGGLSFSNALCFGVAHYFCGVIRDNACEGLSCATKRKSLVYIAFGLTGNLFAVLSMLTMIKEESALEYKLAYHSALITSMLCGVAVLNLFKEEVTTIQKWGAVVLIGLFALQWGGVYLVGRYTTVTRTDVKLKTVGYLYLFMALSGNLLLLLTGVVILVKLKTQDDRREIMWVNRLRRLLRNPTATGGMVFVVLLFALSVYSFLIFDYSLAVQNDYAHSFEPPSLAYPFGADEFGRDVFVRILFGARISLIVGVVSTVIPIVAGGFLGALAGFYGRRTDNVIMRLLDILYAIPGILLAIAIVAAFGANTMNLILALSIGGIPGYARMVRAQVMQLADCEFIEASRAIGTPNWKIIFEDIIPNALSPVIVRATLGIGGAVLATSSLSYLGLGVQPPTPEWGNILKAGSEYLEFYPHLAIFPGLAIVAVVLAFNFFGDGLRDALDPKLK